MHIYFPRQQKLCIIIFSRDENHARSLCYPANTMHFFFSTWKHQYLHNFCIQLVFEQPGTGPKCQKKNTYLNHINYKQTTISDCNK